MALNAINLSATGNAISEGLDSYLKAKQLKDQKDYQQQSLQMQAAEHGLIKDPETGLLTPSPAAQGKIQHEASQYDANNPVAESNRGLLKSTIKQVHPEYTEEQLDAAAPKGLTAKAYSDQIGLIKPQVSGTYMVQSRAPLAEVGKERNQIMRDQGGQRIDLQSQSLGLRTGKAANDINKQVMGDPVVKATDMQQNSITKGMQQLNSTDKPITNQMLNEIQADYANVLTGGRQAAQGTIHDQQMQTLAGKAANLRQYITGAPTEAATPAQIAYFKTAFNELRGLNQQIRESRVNSLTKGATAAYGDKGAFGSVVNNLKDNANGQGLIPASSPGAQGLITPPAQMSRAEKEAAARKLMGQ